MYVFYTACNMRKAITAVVHFLNQQTQSPLLKQNSSDIVLGVTILPDCTLYTPLRFRMPWQPVRAILLTARLPHWLSALKDLCCSRTSPSLMRWHTLTERESRRELCMPREPVGLSGVELSDGMSNCVESSAVRYQDQKSWWHVGWLCISIGSE